MSPRDLEKCSSAFTLSDMEIFIFPELLYSLVLANILSPEIWKWRKDPWFREVEKKSPIKRIHRLKQYIMDHYDFNIDLETWELTDKETEVSRFRDFMDLEVLSQSNALFGYEGDKYYFDIDIRKHFGLDKYDTDVIPYWKTETVEAMNAFRFREGHQAGAGECVSLAALYAAALFIVARIPPEQIFLLGTPLHSQNFILVEDGVLTNNRRIVTRSMWYNGTELSALARRALEHEQVTIVAHPSGYIHSVYPEATINPADYARFRESLISFLDTGIDFEIFINFLRAFNRHQKLFQIAVPCHGTERYLPLEKAFGYEHGSKNRLGDKTARKLLCEIDEEDFCCCRLDDRAVLHDKDTLFRKKPYAEFVRELMQAFPALDPDHQLRNDLKRFVHTVPKLPSADKIWADRKTGGQADRRTGGLEITTEMSREEIMEAVIRANSQEGTGRGASAFDLALYAGRWMEYCDWGPFLKAAMERNPVSIAYFREKDPKQVSEQLARWPDESIYEGNRLSMPDEVVNFKRGDGIEKALTLANIIRSRLPGEKISLEIHDREVRLRTKQGQYLFDSRKQFRFEISF